MTISYNWLHDYLTAAIEPERLSRILTSIGLEVESLEKYESLPGGLKGLVIGEVLEAIAHPNADKLKLTKVNIGAGEPLQIVCGAPNVATGQKVVVATVGSTIHPKKGEPLTMKVAKIRGVESYGMICAEDEIGLSDDHNGIMVLPSSLVPGTPAAEYFRPYNDWIYEIGLTPNRMDAMSHLGVARDLMAYLSHHDRKAYKLKSPYAGSFKTDNKQLPVKVTIENSEACQRYSGISISNVTIKESPSWLQDKLRSIGQRPINNIVDITNFILHETGQPLHAFDADKIGGRTIRVMNLPEGTPFVTLDGKERKLSQEDLMICDSSGKGLCIAGVFGGADSGVTAVTANIFLESAWFNPVDIRKTSFRHGLRTDAAMRFEKNTDISNTVNVLKRAALLIKELAGGEVASDIVDEYPDPRNRPEITLKFHYLKKLSGKNYHSDTVKNILQNLGFDIIREGMDDIRTTAPYSKPDVHLPADVVEEIMRIDGLDNIEIPSAITITPSIDINGYKHTWKEKIAGYLVGLGFNEIFTNSITNAAYFEEEDLKHTVKLLNNLSAEHNIMRPSMLETGLEVVAHNLNRKNSDLRFFEFGKTYSSSGSGQYHEKGHLCLYITGQVRSDSWKEKGSKSDLYYLKGLLAGILQLTGIENIQWNGGAPGKLDQASVIKAANETVAELGMVHPHELKRFDIKQPVWFADIQWETILRLITRVKLKVEELPKQLPVHRDLAMIVPQTLPYGEVEKAVKQVRVDKLTEMRLFDIFESEKLGAGKKSMAVSFTFLDQEKTLTDAEIDKMMGRIMNALESGLSAEIRK